MKAVHPDFRPVIVVPTYNNARTLPPVLDRLDTLGIPIIAVNDGCTDQTAELLAQWAQKPGSALREVVTHSLNRGKGAALISGFARAAELSFTHAGTMDTDGQLAPEELPAFFAAAAQAPDALILGHRHEDTPNLPRANLTAWYLSALGLWQETGLVIYDTQCGLRVYPLSLFQEVHCRTRRFGFETEALARAMWSGYSLALIPVSCQYEAEGKQASHLKPVRDGVKGFFMHWALALRRLLPLREIDGRKRERRAGCTTYTWREWLSPLAVVRRIRSSRLEQLITSAAFAHGAFLACMPLGGLQFVLLPYTSRRLRHNFWAALTGLLLIVPPTGPWLARFSLKIGNAFTFGGPTIGHTPHVFFGPFWRTFLEAPWCWLGGSIVVGTIVHWVIIGALFSLFQLVPIARGSRNGSDG